LVALALGIAATPLAARAGERLKLLDRPSPIKPHARPTPYTGGSALILAFGLAAPISGVAPAALLGALLVWAIGLVDDIRGLSPLTKLAAEVPALAIGSLAFDLAPLDRLVAVAAGVVMINVFNVTDGLDGLAAGVAAVMLVPFALVGPAVAVGAAALGATLGFLLFNLPPARVFLGDQGSLWLGYLLWILPLSWYLEVGLGRALIATGLIWLFPIANSIYVLAVRMRHGRPLLRGDRSHLYDALNRRYGLGRTLGLCWGIAVIGVGCFAALMRAA
jgi:UDP-GlcNAc:undecaprenyl-phosphate GlcNAc-1-phosphate transferase